jgi:predicted transcriptional regulator of viral defense system
MTSTEALARLRKLRVPVLETGSAGAALGLSAGTAHKVLRRIAETGLVRHLFHGLWSVEDAPDPLALPDYVTSPLPSYISLQTALYHHGLISQIPAVIHAVTIGRTRRVETSLGTYSIHHVAPAVFGGFETGPTGVRMASPEKALFDVLYLSGKRSREFAALPELELPREFRWGVVDEWLLRVSSPRDRTLIHRRVEQLRGRGRRASARSRGPRRLRPRP